MTDKELAVQASRMQQELKQTADKISELEMERDEHKLVIQAMQGMEKTRRCYRLVGGVMIEGTAGEVLPTLESNSIGISELLSKLTDSYKKQTGEFIEFQKTHKIQFE